jgi:hypothetical protein
LTAGTTFGGVEQGTQVVDHEVTDTDGADLAVGHQPFEGPVGGHGLVEVAGQRLVQDEQVDLVDAELAGTLVEGVQRLVVAVVADPDLRLQEHLLARDARVAEGFADLALVAIGGRSVDVAVADVEGGSDGSTGLFGRRLEDAEAEGGHPDTVVQLQGLHEAVPSDGCGGDSRHVRAQRRRCCGWSSWSP